MVRAIAAGSTSLVASVHPDTVADLQTLYDRLVVVGLSVWLVRHDWGIAVAVASSAPGTAGGGTAVRLLADLDGDGFDWAETVPGVVRVGRGQDTSRWVELERWTIGEIGRAHV
jgi:hypothetical protein